MNKLVLKTAAITLTVAISASLLAVCVMALFFPSVVASSSAKMGLYSIGANFEQIAYNRHPSTERLGKLIDFAAAGKRYGMLVKYCPEMAEDSHFEKYAAYRDENKDSLIAGDYKNYLYGTYAVALYKKNRETEALAAVKVAVSREYPKNNAAQYLLYAELDKEDDENLLLLVEYLEGLYYFLKLEGGGSVQTTEMSDLCKDITICYESLGPAYAEVAAMWSSRI